MDGWADERMQGKICHPLLFRDKQTSEKRLRKKDGEERVVVGGFVCVSECVSVCV